MDVVVQESIERFERGAAAHEPLLGELRALQDVARSQAPKKLGQQPDTWESLRTAIRGVVPPAAPGGSESATAPEGASRPALLKRLTTLEGVESLRHAITRGAIVAEPPKAVPRSLHAAAPALHEHTPERVRTPPTAAAALPMLAAHLRPEELSLVREFADLEQQEEAQAARRHKRGAVPPSVALLLSASPPSSEPATTVSTPYASTAALSTASAPRHRARREPRALCAGDEEPLRLARSRDVAPPRRPGRTGAGAGDWVPPPGAAGQFIVPEATAVPAPQGRWQRGPPNPEGPQPSTLHPLPEAASDRRYSESHRSICDLARSCLREGRNPLDALLPSRWGSPVQAQQPDMQSAAAASREGASMGRARSQPARGGAAVAPAAARGATRWSDTKWKSGLQAMGMLGRIMGGGKGDGALDGGAS